MLGRKADPWEQFKFKSFRSLYQAEPTAYCLLFLHSFPPVRVFQRERRARSSAIRNLHDTVILFASQFLKLAGFDVLLINLKIHIKLNMEKSYIAL
jgi:uncharacterized protein (DUF1786 family)